jgi:hypothetical protein
MYFALKEVKAKNKGKKQWKKKEISQLHNFPLHFKNKIKNI